jgi:hypothetical protein
VVFPFTATALVNNTVALYICIFFSIDNFLRSHKYGFYPAEHTALRIRNKN